MSGFSVRSGFMKVMSMLLRFHAAVFWVGISYFACKPVVLEKLKIDNFIFRLLASLSCLSCLLFFFFFLLFLLF